MHDKDLYKTILGIEAPWSIADVTMDAEGETITVRVELKPGATRPCPACGRSGCGIKDRRERTWRHLDTCQFKTLISAPLPRSKPLAEYRVKQLDEASKSVRAALWRGLTPSRAEAIKGKRPIRNRGRGRGAVRAGRGRVAIIKDRAFEGAVDGHQNRLGARTAVAHIMK